VPILLVSTCGDDKQDAVDLNLLALRGVRRNLESGEGERIDDASPAPMVGSEPAASARVDDLRDLIAALDRRQPRHDREGEAAIARDAAALREKALARIAALVKPL
jgi:hypothetical protein